MRFEDEFVVMIALKTACSTPSAQPQAHADPRQNAAACAGFRGDALAWNVIAAIFADLS